jgi:hypothetical protein
MTWFVRGVKIILSGLIALGGSNRFCWSTHCSIIYTTAQQNLLIFVNPGQPMSGIVASYLGMITIDDKKQLARLLGPISRQISHGSPMSPGELEALLQKQGYKQSREALCEIQSWQQILSLARGQPSKAKQAQSQLEARGIPIAPCTLAVQTAVVPQQQPAAKPVMPKVTRIPSNNDQKTTASAGVNARNEWIGKVIGFSLAIPIVIALFPFILIGALLVTVWKKWGKAILAVLAILVILPIFVCCALLVVIYKVLV